MIPFHSICGDAPELEKKFNPDDASDGIRTNQDGALAMGKGAAMKELLSLPIGELERRCRHNGLSLVGGRETMVARLLYLEEAEKQRGYELNDNLKYAQGHSSSGRYPSGQKETNVEPEAPGLSKWPRNGEDELASQGKDSGLFSSTLHIPELEHGDYTDKGKTEPVLTASKWAREDDDSDDEQKTSTRDLGLTYSSSGSENAGDNLSKALEVELATDASIPVHPESGINEEQRLDILHTISENIICGI